MNNRVLVIGTDGRNLRTIIQTDGHAYEVAWISSERNLVVTTNKNMTFIYDVKYAKPPSAHITQVWVCDI